MKPIKIVCLVKNHPHTVYFVNRINQVHAVSLVIIEEEIKRSVSFSHKLSQFIKNYLSHLIFRRKSKIRQISYDEVFSNLWQSFNPSLRIVRVSDINSSEVVRLIKKEGSDLILDHGTSLLSNEVIGSAKLALNLHWGLSPYYRGTHCTDWALINWDPYNIGVTIHKLAKKIDGGDILAQERVEIKNLARAKAINLLLTKTGTELVIRAVSILQSGKRLKFIKQNLALGYMTSTAQWSSPLQQQLDYLETPDIFQKMLARPARRKKLPIITL